MVAQTRQPIEGHGVLEGAVLVAAYLGASVLIFALVS